MTTHSESDYTWRKSRSKGILTRRTDFDTNEMDYNENLFTSDFNDNDDLLADDDNANDGIENDSGENNEEEKKKKMSENDLVGSCSSNDGFDNNMFPLETARYNQSIEAVVNRVFGGGDDVDLDLLEKVSDLDENADIDFTDTALSLSIKKPLTNNQGDQTDKDIEDITDAPKNTKFGEVKHKKRSRFTPSVKFGWFDLLVGTISICLFFADIGTDIELAVHYFRNEMWIYGGVTTGLIVIPSLVTCFLGLHWYIIDCNKEKELLQRLETLGDKVVTYETPNYVWFLRFFFTLLQCGPVIRVVEYLYCGYKSRCKHVDQHERKRYHRLMLYGDADSCLLRLFESFLEAAPQLTWQLYIVIDLKPEEDDAGTSIRVLSMLSSWGSLALSLTSYHKSLRNSHEEKAKMSLKSLPLYFIWRACETGGRMLCIAMFASAFRLWVFGPLIFHWAFMSGWLILQKTTFYKNKCMEKVFNIICGYVMIFCFLNLREGQTRFRFLLFYFIFYIGNFIMLALWFRFTQDLGAWFHLWGFIVVLLLFVLHVTFQLLYYTFLHPTKNIKLCLPCTHNVVCSSICYEVQSSD